MLQTASLSNEIPVPFATAEVVAQFGGDETYTVLTIRVLEDGKVELNASLVEYDARSGHYDTEDLGSEVTGADDEAIIAADDLDHLAAKALDERNVGRRYGEDFGTAVQNWLDARERAAAYAIAAE